MGKGGEGKDIKRGNVWKIGYGGEMEWLLGMECEGDRKGEGLVRNVKLGGSRVVDK